MSPVQNKARGSPVLYPLFICVIRVIRGEILQRVTASTVPLVLFRLRGHNPRPVRAQRPRMSVRGAAGRGARGEGGGRSMSNTWKRILTVGLLLGVVVGSFVYFRQVYTTSKRLRTIDPGRFYRSGQLSEVGFRDAVERF